MREGETEKFETLLEDIRAQLRELNTRVSRLESREAEPIPRETATAAPTEAETEAAPESPVLSEERLLAISAAVAAFFGERVRIRQIRLLSSSAWAQQGRVSVQASHWLHH